VPFFETPPVKAKFSDIVNVHLFSSNSSDNVVKLSPEKSCAQQFFRFNQMKTSVFGQVAFYGSNISKVIFPKTYGNDTDYPACLWTNTFGGDESLSEIVFQNATPIELFYNKFTEYTFGDMASEDFHITLIGAAKGLEQKYIDAWKYRFIACENNDPSVNEEKLNQSVKKIAGLLGYTLPETGTQPDDNQEVVPDVEKAPEDNQQEVNDEDQNDQQDENKQEALENEVDENDN
jgi:hypothetical protein